MRSNSSRSNSCSKTLNSQARDSQFYSVPTRARSSKKSRGRSQSLERQQKYPPLITPLNSKPTPQHFTWTLQKTQVIEEKSQIQEDENLQKMIQQIEAISEYSDSKSQFQISQGSPPPSPFYFENRLGFQLNMHNLMHEQVAPYSYDEKKFISIIEECLVFWKREQFNEFDNKKFYESIQKYILIHFRPAPLDELGQKLLKNGFFILAYIKYMSSRDVNPKIKTMLFEMFKNDDQIQTNYEQFMQAYLTNAKQNQKKQEIMPTRQSRFGMEVETLPGQDKRSVNKTFRTKENLKRKYSGQFNKQYNFRSREKYSGKEYRSLENLIVKTVISSALGSLREFLLVETQNKDYELPQFIVIPKKKSQTINSISLNQALYQAEQITRSSNIFFFNSPGPQFNTIYDSLTPYKML